MNQSYSSANLHPTRGALSSARTLFKRAEERFAHCFADPLMWVTVGEGGVSPSEQTV